MRLVCMRMNVRRSACPLAQTQRRFVSHQYSSEPPVALKKKADGVEKWFSKFDLSGKVFVVTGGGQGLGFTMAQGLVAAGGKVHCLDRASQPVEAFVKGQELMKKDYGGELIYHQVDVTQDVELEKCIEGIAAAKQRLDGLIAGKSG